MRFYDPTKEESPKLYSELEAAYAELLLNIRRYDHAQLAAFTCIAVGPPFIIKEGYDRAHPYCTGVAELEEGLRIVARIEGVDTTKPETIKFGTPLTAHFLHRGEGKNQRSF